MKNPVFIMRDTSRKVGATAMALFMAMLMLVSFLAPAASAEEVAGEPVATEVTQVQVEEPASVTDEVTTEEVVEDVAPAESQPESVVEPDAPIVEVAPVQEVVETVVPAAEEQPVPETVPGPEPPAEVPPVQEEIIEAPAEELTAPQVEYSTEAYPGSYFGFGALNATPVDFAPDEIYPYTATINGDGKFINSFSNVIPFPVGGVATGARNTEEYIICTPKDLTITITDRDGRVVGEVVANAAKAGTFTRQCDPFDHMSATLVDNGDGTGVVSVVNASDFALQAYITVNGTGEVVDVPAQTTIPYDVNEPGSVIVQAYDQNGPREIFVNGEVKAFEPAPDPFDSVKATVEDNGDGTGAVVVVNNSDQLVQVQAVVNDIGEVVDVPAGETVTIPVDESGFVTVRAYDESGPGKVLADGTIAVFVPPPHGEPNPGDEYTDTPKYPNNVVDKVTFCHLTGNGSYRRLTTDPNGFYQAGHHTHQGVDEGKGDVVPAFSTETQGRDRDMGKYRNFDGLNNGEGAQEFIDNNCKDVDDEPKPEDPKDPEPKPEPEDPKDPQPEDPKDPADPKPQPEDPKDPQPEDPKDPADPKPTNPENPVKDDEDPAKDGKDDERSDNKQAESKDVKPMTSGRGHNVQGAVTADSSSVLAPGLMGLGMLLILGAATHRLAGRKSE